MLGSAFPRFQKEWEFEEIDTLLHVVVVIEAVVGRLVGEQKNPTFETVIVVEIQDSTDIVHSVCDCQIAIRCQVYELQGPCSDYRDDLECL